MPANTATILIPDISGFTEFMNRTELEHSSHVINFLLESIVKTVGEEYEVSEIEGDAVLLFKKGDAASKKEVVDLCMKIFNAFHYSRKWIQQVAICPCGACQAVINLRLKFVVHFGSVSEIKVSRFSKLSGVDMIIAHRLLKNSIESDEYLLLTDKLLMNEPDKSDSFELQWLSSADDFNAIGKVRYDFALLENLRNKVPSPPPIENAYSKDDSDYAEIQINANFVEFHILFHNIPDRARWMTELKKVEQEFYKAYIGSIHRCTFENYTAIVSPLQMDYSPESILYAETWQIEEFNLSMVYEYVFRSLTDHSCMFGYRILSAQCEQIPGDKKTMLMNNLRASVLRLKEICEMADAEKLEY